MTDFKTTDFDGALLLKHYMADPDGQQYIGYSGKVSILAAKEMLGFEVTGQETNWVARVEGPSGQSVNFPGCQVRGVFVDCGEPRQNGYKVLP